MDLTPLLRPTSIGLVGASPDGTPAEVLANLRRIGFAGRIVAVNPRRDRVDGLPCHPTLAAAGAAVDVAAIMVKASRVPGALRDCVAAGARSAVVFADGFSAADPDGPALQREIADIARTAGLPVLGPNCMGYLAPAYGSGLYIDHVARMPAAGTVGLVTQSGSVGVAGINHTGTFALSAMVSIGNEAVVGLADAVGALAGDGVTRAVAVFAEGIRDGRALLAAAGRARAQGVRLVVCKTGRSPAAVEAARSHTGALANDQRIVRAMLEAHGVALVDDLDEMFAAAELLATGRRFGRSLAAVTLSGGHVGLLHDVAAASGLRFPEPEPEVRDGIETALKAPRAVANPCDAWANDDVVGGVAAAAQALARSRRVDGLVFAVDTPADPPTSFAAMGRGIAQAAAALAAADSRPVVMATTAIAADDPEVTRTLRSAGVPRLVGLRATLAAWGSLCRAEEAALPRPVDALAAAPIPARASEPELYHLLAEHGFDLPRFALCHDRADARRAAAVIGYPVAVKVVSTRIAHKTEVGGVILGVADATGLDRAVDRLLAIPEAEGVMVAEMVADGIEALIGLHADPAFGPVVVIGAGGIYAELIDDAAVLPAPTTEAQVLRALEGLRLGRLLAGLRGRAPTDPAPLAALVARLSRLAADGVSLDLNPVRLVDGRAVVLDADVVASPSVQGQAA